VRKRSPRRSDCRFIEKVEEDETDMTSNDVNRNDAACSLCGTVMQVPSEFELLTKAGLAWPVCQECVSRHGLSEGPADDKSIVNLIRREGAA